jgi:DNA-binding transcriptional LysR family regulator
MDSDAAEVLVRLVGAAETPPGRSELLTVECDNSEVLKRILAESDAVTFMPRFIVDDELRHGRLASIAGVDPGLRVRFGAARLPGRTLGGAGTTFLDLLRTHDDGLFGAI